MLPSVSWPGQPDWNAFGVLENCQKKINLSGEQGNLIFTRVYGVLAQGANPSLPLCGLPVSIKDLFDVAGETTLAGSKVLGDNAPAVKDAAAVARLKSAGAVVIGKTAMTEFAYSGLGVNPHYGTPGNYYDHSRIPGGSSAGAGIAVRSGMCLASLGTDTNGSIRIPAAYSGTVGFRPSSARVPQQGMVQLSPTQDSIGTIASTVTQCASLNAVLSGRQHAFTKPKQLKDLVIGVPTGFLLDDLDPAVSSAFQKALSDISRSGGTLREIRSNSLDIAREIGPGGIAGPEAFRWHRQLLETRYKEYDPRVAARLRASASVSNQELIERYQARSRAISEYFNEVSYYDVVISPCVPILPPLFREVEQDEDYFRVNALILRNTSAYSVLDAPSITIPISRHEKLPIGLMISCTTGLDVKLLTAARSIEAILA